MIIVLLVYLYRYNTYKTITLNWDLPKIGKPERTMYTLLTTESILWSSQISQPNPMCTANELMQF